AGVGGLDLADDLVEGVLLGRARGAVRLPDGERAAERGGSRGRGRARGRGGTRDRGRGRGGGAGSRAAGADHEDQAGEEAGEPIRSFHLECVLLLGRFGIPIAGISAALFLLWTPAEPVDHLLELRGRRTALAARADR